MNHRAPLPALDPDVADYYDAFLIDVLAESRTYDRLQEIRERWGFGL